MTRHIVALWIIPFVMCLLATIAPAAANFASIRLHAGTGGDA